MAIAPIRIPRLSQGQPFVDQQGRLSNEALRRMNEILTAIERSFNGIIDAINAANAAQAAAETAQTAAETAQAAADSAATAGGANAREQALVNSGPSPGSVLTSDPTTITIAAHTRIYGDGSSVSVAGGTVAATATGDTDYVYYSDPTRAGGAVTYQVSTTQPIQTGDTHVVGAVLIPMTGTVPGGTGPRYPGKVEPLDNTP